MSREDGSWEDPRAPEDRLAARAADANGLFGGYRSNYIEQAKNRLIYSKNQLLAFGGVTAALAMGGVAWDASAGAPNQPNIKASVAHVFPNCAPPSQRAVETVRQLFRPHSHRAVYPGIAARQLGLTVPYEDDNLFYSADSTPHEPARVNAYLKAANSQLVYSGLKVVAGTEADAKNGWQVPTTQELQSEFTEDNLWEITSETSNLPAQYVSLSGIKKIALMYKKGGPGAAVISTGKHKEDTVVYNLAYDQFIGQTQPVDTQIAHKIDQKGCASGKKDPAWEKLNGNKNIYGKDNHKGLVAQQPTTANALIFNLENNQYVAHKAGDKKAYCQATADIARVEKDQVVVESPADFASEAADKADVGSKVSYPNLLGWVLSRDTPAIRAKTLLSLERLEDLDGPGQDGPAIVKYFAKTYVTDKQQTLEPKINC